MKRRLFSISILFISFLMVVGLTSCLTESESAHKHTFSDEWTIDKEATCMEAGEKSHHCGGCEERSDITSIPSLGHTPSSTWESNAETHWKVCEVCHEKIEETGHTFGEWEITSVSTTTTEGSKKRVCNICGYEETVRIEPHEHTFSTEWSIDKEATCTETGEKSHHCEVCGEKTDITEIPAQGHAPSGIWKSDEETHWKECEVCHEKVEETEHIFGEWEITSASTTTTEGSKKRVCNICGYEETVRIEPHEHTFSTEWSIDREATCTETGEKSHHCEGCEERSDITSISALGHTPSSIWESNAETHWKECEVCHEKVEETGHIFADNQCSICGYKKELEYKLNSDNLSYYVVGIGTMTDMSIVIPSTFNDLPVTSIGSSAFYGCSSLTSITIPNSVTSIGSSAFYGCSSLTSITIGNGVTGIEYRAFAGCSSLTSITIGNSVTSIGRDAFEYCSSLINVDYEGSIEDWCNITFSISTSNPMYYASHFYLRNSNNQWKEVTNIEIPNTITRIGSYQFGGFSSITSITIPNSVTSIGSYAFSNCSSLTSITIPDSVTSIGYYVFINSSKLKNVYYEGGIEDWCNITVNDSLFDMNSTTGFIYFYLKDSNNQWKEVTNIEIPNTITRIGSYQFGGFSSITSITIPNSVTSIGSYAFYGCSSLTSITIPNSVTSIGSYAFSGCYRLVEVYNLSTLDITAGSSSYGYIGYCAKVVHTSLEEESSLIEKDDYLFIKDNEVKYYLVEYRGTETELTLPEDIEGNSYEINTGAFYNCSKLTSIIIPDSVTSIGEDAFWKCSSLTSITIPFVGASLNGTENTNFGYIFGVGSYVYNSSYVPSSLKEVIITGGESIGGRAFDGCSSLTSITIGNGVTGIENRAFDGCSNLTSITIPNSVTSIGANAFYNCSNLANVYYEGNIEDWCNITFSSGGIYSTSNPMYYASHFYLRNSENVWEEITSIEIPDTITEIGDCQFMDFNNLTSITIPNSVTSIGEYAFYRCYKLVEVYNLSTLSITTGTGNSNCGWLGYYAKVIHTSLEEESNLIEKDDYLFIKDNEGEYYLVEYWGAETELSLPEDIEGSSYEIIMRAFYNCSNLTSITIPNSVTSIGSSAFYGCSSLTSITIPNSVTSIGSSAFYGCSSLTSITIGNGVTSIGSSAFIDCYRLVEVYNLSTLDITAGSSSYGYVGYYAKVVHTSLEEESNLIEKDDYLFIKDNEGKYYLVEYRGTEIELSLPEDIEGSSYEIIMSAFYNCSNLTSITIPNSVTSIGSSAFYGCSSLTSITIPNSVTSIGSSAFHNCSNLTEVYYGGTSTDWNNISINYGNTYLTSAIRYYYSEIKPTTSGNYWHYVDGVVTRW